MNFLHLSTFYPPYSFGGDAMYIYRLAHALGDLGHEVDVIHCLDAYHLQHPAEPELQFAEHPNVRRHGLHSRYGWLSPLLTQQTGRPYLKTKSIQQVLASKPYDVIHYHNISLLGPEILQIAQPGVPAVKLYTTHEHWLICPMHVLWKYNSRACDKPDCLKCSLAGKRPPQLWRYTGLIERASRGVDRFVSPSRFTARMHAQRGFPRPLSHLPYFIERADQDWQNPPPRPHPRPYFLFVGRLEKIKGVQTLIDAWRQVMDYDLVVAGSGGQAEALQAQADQAGLLRQTAARNDNKARVIFTGPLPQSQLGAYYTHALATIVPSLTYETFGVILLESFARKTPVIVRDLGALPEIVHDSQGGLVFTTQAELLAALDQFGRQPELRKQLGENGYQAFLKYWTKEAHLELYFDLLNALAMEKHGHLPWG